MATKQNETSTQHRLSNLGHVLSRRQPTQAEAREINTLLKKESEKKK